MKKYMIYALAACMTVLGAGCSKDFEDAGAEQTPVVEGKYRLPSLSASLDDDAETRTGEPNATTGAVNWETNDRILIVNTSNWSKWQYRLVKGASSPIGEFEPILGGTEASSDDPNFGDLVAVYPVSAAYVENKKLSFKINQNWYPKDDPATTDKDEAAEWKKWLEDRGIKSWTKDTQYAFNQNDIKVSYKCTPTTTDKNVNSANFKFRQLGAWCKFEFDFSTDETYSQEKLLRIAVSTVDGTTNFTGTAEVDLTTDRNNPTLKTSGDGTSIDWTFNSGSNMNIPITRSMMLYPGELSNQRLKIVAETTLHTFTFYATPKQALKAGTVFHFPLSLGFKSFGENDVDAAASKELAYTVTDKAQIPFYYYGGTNCYLAMNGQPVTVKCTPYKTDAYFHNTETAVSDNVLGAEYTPTHAKLIWYESALGAAPTVGAYDADNDSFTVTMPSGKYGNALVGVYNAAGKILWSYHIWAPEDDPTKAVNPDDPKAMKLYKNTYSGEYTVMPMALGATKVAVPNEAVNQNRIDGVGFWYQWGRKDPLGRPAQWNNNYTVAVTTVADPTNEINAVAEAAGGTGTFFRNAAYNEVQEKTEMNVLYLAKALLAGGYTDDIANKALDRTEVEKTIDGKKYKMSADRYMIDQAIANPTRFIVMKSEVCSNDWAAQTNDNLWGNPKGYEYPRMSQTYKSIFDPCPAGYRVAPADIWINFSTTGENTNVKWKFNVKGPDGKGHTNASALQNGFEFYYEGMGESVAAEDGTSGTYTEPEDGKTDFYPVSGWRERTIGYFLYVNVGGYCWTSSPQSSNGNGRYIDFHNSGVSPLGNSSRAMGFTIRCVKEK